MLHVHQHCRTRVGVGDHVANDLGHGLVAPVVGVNVPCPDVHLLGCVGLDGLGVVRPEGRTPVVRDDTWCAQLREQLAVGERREVRVRHRVVDDVLAVGPGVRNVEQPSADAVTRGGEHESGVDALRVANRRLHLGERPGAVVVGQHHTGGVVGAVHLVVDQR